MGDKDFAFSLERISGHHHFLQAPPGDLYHYTTLPGAAGIFKERALWLSNIHFMNDSRELAHAFDLARHSAVDHARHIDDGDGVKCVEEWVTQLSSFQETNICVASFCEDGDLLSQWRGYSAGSQGVSIGFATEILEQCAKVHAASLLKCVYQEALQQEIIRGFAEYMVDARRHFGTAPNSEIIGYYNTLFLRLAPALKDDAFSEEREWRLVTMPIKITDTRYSVRPVSNGLLPYYVLGFGTESPIDHCYLGPSGRFERNRKALHTLALKCGTQLRFVHPSRVPYVP
jgi:hypothetical protein